MSSGRIGKTPCNSFAYSLMIRRLQIVIMRNMGRRPLEIPGTMMHTVTDLSRFMKTLMLSLLVVALMLPAVHVYAHADHDSETSGQHQMLDHVLLSTDDAVFAHVHDALGKSEISDRHHGGLHIHLIQNVLTGTRLDISDPLEPLDFDPYSFAVYDDALVQHGLPRYRSLHLLHLSGLQFIKRLTSLPPPPLRPVV